jgi:hypothetical protein
VLIGDAVYRLDLLKKTTATTINSREEGEEAGRSRIKGEGKNGARDS